MESQLNLMDNLANEEKMGWVALSTGVGPQLVGKLVSVDTAFVFVDTDHGSTQS